MHGDPDPGWLSAEPARDSRRVTPHAHHHQPATSRDVRLLLVALALITGFLAVELVVAVLASSLALLADAGHLLVDALALVMATVAARLARRPAGGVWTYGLGRVEVLSAAVNGVTLLVAAVVIAVESVRRLVEPPDVAGRAVVVVAVAGLAVNLVTTLVLSRADRSSLNVSGAIAHVATDAAAFAATLVAGLIVVITGANRADPAASLVVVALMLVAAVPLLRKSLAVLLDRAPEHVDLENLRAHLLESTEVVAVHDLHVWSVGSALPVVSAHVVVGEECFVNGGAPRVLDELQRCLAGHFDVEHSTFQLEPTGHADHEPGTH